jgi:curli biogenesis system outer membrane secretion channel CsgG
VKGKLQSLTLLILLSGLSSGDCAEAEAGGQAASLPVVVVVPFDGSNAQIPGWSPAIGQAVSEMLIDSLGNKDKRFQVVEASGASGQQNEIPASPAGSGSAGAKSNKGAAGGSPKPAADASDDSQKPEAGGSADSDFILSGNVAAFSVQTNSSKIGDFISSSSFAGLGAKVVTAHVQIDWRLVDAETKRIIMRNSAAGSAHGTEFDTSALATSEEKAPVDGTAATTPKAAQTSAAPTTAGQVKTAKAPAGGNGGAGSLASVSNIFNGLNKAWGGSTAGAGAGDNAKGSGTVAKFAKTPPAAGGNAVGNENQAISYDDSAFMRSALGRATAEAITNIMEQLASVNLPEPGRAIKLRTATNALKHTPGKVLAVAGKDTIIVSLGSKEGFKEGDTLELYQPTDVKDDKGNVVFTDEKLVGEITLQAVQDDKSRASYAGDTQVQQGWTVKAK